jgi:hypothetical protein
LGARNIVVSSNHPVDRNGIPIEAKSRVDDPGVAVYFLHNGKPMAMARDGFNNATANMRSLGLAIEGMRQLERHGGGVMMERAFAGFVALPPPRSCWDVLGVKPRASRDEIERAFREAAKRAHPDVGGSAAAMAEINAARDQALAEI